MLVSLVALWGFSAWVTVSDGVNLLWATTIDANVVEPSEPLLWGLQRERRLTIDALGSGTALTQQLRAQREDNDRLRQAFDTSARSSTTQWAAADALITRSHEVLRQLATLPELRRSIDAGKQNRKQAQAAYDGLIDSFYPMYDTALAVLGDEQIDKDGRTLTAMSRARELLSRQDALVSGILAGGGFTRDDQAAVAKASIIAAYALDQAASALPAEDQQAFREWRAGASVTQLRALERTMASADPTGSAPITAQQWRTAADGSLSGLNTMIQDGGDHLVDRAAPVAVGVLVRLLIAGGLGLVAVVASIVLAVTTTRALLAQLNRLRAAALDLAERRLPGVVERVSHGQNVDLAEEAPPLAFGPDEIGEVARAFNTVQETAIRVSVEQAELRLSTRNTLTSLARRTQGLVKRQLDALDVMQRRATTPEELTDLYALDHLVVRTRRAAENLLVLAGATPARTWRRSVPLLDVVRGALAEVEDYRRVSINPLDDSHLLGKAVGDLTHLLAELIDNAVSFSPPNTAVTVSGQHVANGYVLEIEDRGLGMSSADLAEANRQIADPPEFKITGTAARLGFYVVSRLAARHDIVVTLKSSPYGGVAAVVLVPLALLQEPEQGDPFDPDAPSPEQTTAPTAPARPRPRSSVQQGATPPPHLPQRTTPAVPRPDRTAPPLSAPTPSTAPAFALPVRQRTTPTAPPPPQTTPPTADRPLFTPGGLPLRVPQTSLVPELRDQPAPSATSAWPDEPTPGIADDEDELRTRLAALQRGTVRGRAAAERLLGERDPYGDQEST
ncbi:nitrate- and nitrite sensing domain-containing protein [Nonomuraea sp. NPDC059194]|uniref:nitrate- and nitrite sensing domain-containing protein n=1 Tax=Nonomuraea sp. NPDC059194 TaxID=3346764 RepID=UPI00369C2F25